jgi:hypothetical protein
MFHRERPKPRKDYLKYWRVVKRYVMKKYGLTSAELDMILFLHSEDYFGRSKFKEFNEILSWDKRRFNKLLREGWIEMFRKRIKNDGALYQLSYKATNVIHYIYRKLEGDDLPVDKLNKDASYTDKVYRNMIIEMNKNRKDERY